MKRIIISKQHGKQGLQMKDKCSVQEQSTFLNNFTSLISIAGGTKTIHLIIWLVFIVIIFHTALQSINPARVELLTNILTGSGFANLVTLVFGVLSISISIMFYVLSESRSKVANEKSSEMLLASQFALSDIQNLINTRFDSTNETTKIYQDEIIKNLAAQREINSEALSTSLDKLATLLSNRKQLDEGKLTDNVENIKNLINENKEIDSNIKKVNWEFKKINSRPQDIIYSFDALGDMESSSHNIELINNLARMARRKLIDAGYTKARATANKTSSRDLIYKFINELPAHVQKYLHSSHFIDDNDMINAKFIDSIINSLPEDDF